jgi:signal transduction histidine kinase
MKGIMMLMKGDQLTPEALEYSRHLESRIEQMDGLLNSLTALARVMSDPIEMAPVALSNLLQEVLSQSQTDHPDAPAHFHLLLQSDTVWADRNLLAALLLELVNNARTFSASATAQVEIVWKSNATEWYLEVKDDGEGIPAEVQPKIFEMFYRGSERSKGNGLGLYIVRKALERLEGRIDFVSKPGETRFMIYLPHRPAAK